MKITLEILLVVFLTGCVSIHNNNLTSDYDLRGQFNTYHSYQIVTNNNLSKKDTDAIHTGIRLSMRALGYIEESSEASIYIYYQVYADNIEIQSFEQSSISSVISRQPYFEGESEDVYPKRIMITGPSLMISFFDPVINTTVWKGYAGQLHERRMNTQAAAQLIMSQYQVLPSIHHRSEHRYALRYLYY